MKPIARLLSAIILTLTTLASTAEAQRHGGHRMGGGLLIGNLCSSAATIATGLTSVELMVKPTPEQQMALNELKSVAKLNVDAMTAACAGGFPGTLPERIALSEKRLDATLAGIHKLKPAVDKFYATLNDEQKSMASGLLILPGL
jgi:hypothetical protein